MRTKMSKWIDSQKNELIERFLRSSDLSINDTNLVRLALGQNNDAKTWKELAGLAGLNSEMTIKRHLDRSFRRFKYSFERKERNLKEQLEECQKKLKVQDDIISQHREMVAKTTSVWNLDFSTRTQIWLKANDIENLYEITQWSEKDILRCRNVGRTTLIEIQDALESKDLRLRQE
jgi:hypothetical protein